VRRWVAGAALVTFGWLASPSAVPVYDGIGTDEPYRRVGASNAPVAVSTKAVVEAGASASLQLKSEETGPQVLIDLASGAFTAATSSITLTATPVANVGTLPRGTFDSNTYRVTVSDGATLRPETAQGFLFLRADVMTEPDPVVVHRASPTDPWVEIRSSRPGSSRDIISTPFRALGDYAVVRLPGAKPLSEGGLSVVRVSVLGAGVLALLTITVLVLRRPDAEDDEPG
jgi:hypothetical protein